MPKAVISNRIYIDKPTELERKKITDALTYKFTSKRAGFTSVETVRNYKVLIKGIMSLPQTREDLVPEHYEILDKRVFVPVPFPDPKFALRESQVPVYEAATDSCFINALVGWGKSVTALYIARKLGQKTLIITHTTALRDQWREEVESLFGIKAGVIGSGVIDHEDHAITIANIQTLIKHADSLASEFGTVIVDECLDYETLVRTKEYGLQKIGVIVNQKKACHVLSVCPETGVASYKQVLSYYKNAQVDCLKIHHSGGGSIKCTANHGAYVYVDGKLEKIPAGDLKAGDLLVCDTTGHGSASMCVTTCKVTSIETATLTGGNRYNIEVADNHTYFANGILVSNCHHVPATTFSESLDKFKARYRIGLSGTMSRKDGKHVMFKDYFGSVVHQPPQANTLTPKIRVVNTGITLKPGATWVDKITDLASSDRYQRIIAAAALRQIEKGHQVLVIADRVEFLQKVHEYVGETCVLVTGDTTFEQRQEAKQQLLSKQKMCVAGSRQIFSEGISINSLSCVILAVPISNDALLEQIIGRIQRQHPDKLDPLVLDMHFAGFADKKQNNDRLGLYMRKGWDVTTV